MSATAKHDFHPDAESLNAFAEQALTEKEHGQVLAHLAVCSRCRQVVVLAREVAADVELAAPAAGRRAALQPDGWWKKWRLVWVPTAAVAAFAVASVSVYLGQVDRSGPAIKIAEQSNEHGGAGTANSPQPEQAQATPPSPPAAAMPQPKSETPTSPSALQGAHSRKHETSTDLDRLTSPNSLQQPPFLNAEEQQVDAGLAPAERSPEYGASSAQSAIRAFRSEQKQRLERKEENETAVDGIPPAMAAPASAHAATGSVAATQQVVVTASNPPLELQTESLAGFGAMKSATAAARSVRVAANINLPSGLPATSTVAIGRRMLAIDNEGTLFLSQDAGNTWNHVTQQWNGRAVVVRRHAAPGATAGALPNSQQLEAAPSDAGGSPPSAPVPASASESTPVATPAPLIFFEILNDKNQAWLSTDGKLWIAQ